MFSVGSLSSDVKLFFYQILYQPVPGRVSDNKFTLKASFPPTLSFPSNFLWDKIFLLVFINTSNMSNLYIFPKFNNIKAILPFYVLFWYFNSPENFNVIMAEKFSNVKVEILFNTKLLGRILQPKMTKLLYLRLNHVPQLQTIFYWLWLWCLFPSEISNQ